MMFVNLSYLYLFLAAAMPSSKFMAIPVNNIIFVILNIFFVSIALYKLRIRLQCAKLIFALMSFILIIIGYYFYGILYQRDVLSANYELFAVLSTLAPLIILAYLINFDKNYYENIIFTLLLGNAIYCATKLFIIFTLFNNNLNVFDVYNALFSLHSLVGGDINYDFGSSFIRIISNNDILTLYLLALLVMIKSQRLVINKYLLMIFIPLSIVSLTFAYSRFIYFMLLLLLIIYGLTNSKRHLFVFGLILSVLISLLSTTNLFDILSMRFNRSYVSISDETRVEQNHFLIKEWQDNLFFGKGLGAYSRDFIRSDMKYLYESQLLSFGLKFGAIGILLFIPFLIYPIRYLLKYIYHRSAIIIITLYILFLAGCNTNPYLLSTASGCVFVIFILMQYRYDSLMKLRPAHG